MNYNCMKPLQLMLILKQLHVKLKNFTISIAFIFILISCKEQKNNNVEKFQCFVSDTSFTHLQYNEIDFSKNRSSMLSLSPIEKGVDSFELRIWVTNMMIPKRLIVLKFDNYKWVAYKYLYYPNEKFIDSMTVNCISTPNEVYKIVSFLTQKEILNLPSQIAIPNFQDNINDGQTCTIEISTKKFYKELEYHCPEHFTKEPNNIKFMGVINYLNQYFKFYNPWCKPGL